MLFPHNQLLSHSFTDIVMHSRPYFVDWALEHLLYCIVTDLCEHYDVIFCQEHWPSPDFLYKIDVVSTDFACFSKSSTKTAVTGWVLLGRPFGGISVLIRNQYASDAKLIALEKRFIVISINNLLLINVYLPNCDSTEEYKSNFLDKLCAVGEIIDQQQNAQVALGGYFNFVFCETNWSYRMLREFSDEYKISPMPLSPSSPTGYSYCQKTLQHHSLIDHFCISVDMVPAVLRVSIDAGNNLSDYLPDECF